MTETVTRSVATVDQIGNIVVGLGLMVMGAMLAAGTLGVPFVGEIAAIALLVTGFMMTRGQFGANGTVGVWMMIVGPAAIIVPPFVPVIWWLAPLAGAGFVILGLTKLVGMWD